MIKLDLKLTTSVLKKKIAYVMMHDQWLMIIKHPDDILLVK